MSKQQQQLVQIAELNFERSLQQLSAVNRDIQCLLTQVDELREKQRNTQASNDDISVQSGYFHKWQAWSETQIRGLMVERARLEAQRQEALSAARLCFGKRQAAQNLLALAAGELRDKKRKRAEQDETHPAH